MRNLRSYMESDMDTLWVVFIGVVSLALLEAVYSLKGGRDYRRLFRLAQERVTQGGEAGEDRLPPVSLILPCRGIDPGLQTNLGAFLTLNYPDFQILFVTDDRSDPCVPLLKALVAGPSRVPARVLIAGPARRRGQKVHNLLHAVEFLRDQDEVLVFGDSDIRPGSGWLKALVETALIPDTGIATGFRWYLPQNGSFASVLRSVWNAGIASLLSRSDNLFAWGGAMAIPRKVFRQCAVRAYWNRALSDDYAASRAIHDHSYVIRFEPRALSFSHEDCRLGELLSWCFRQMAITRVYHPLLWSLALVSQGLNFAALWGGSTLLALAAFTQGVVSPLAFLLSAFLALTYLLGCVKAALRLKAVSSLFPEEGKQIGRHRMAYLLWGPLASLLSLSVLFLSAFRRRISWRGIRYRMVSPEATQVLPRP